MAAGKPSHRLAEIAGLREMKRAAAAFGGTRSRRGQEVGPSGAPDMRAQTFRLAARIPRPRCGRAHLPPDRARSTKAADFPSRHRRGSVRDFGESVSVLRLTFLALILA